MNKIYEEIAAERQRQNEKWGEQNHPMVSYPVTNFSEFAMEYKKINDSKKGIDWFSILMEEVYEAFAETDPVKQRAEIVQVAVVAVQIIEFLDRCKACLRAEGEK